MEFWEQQFSLSFLWQTSQEVEEEILGGQTTVKLRKNNCNEAQISEMRIDVWSGMLLSNVVMFLLSPQMERHFMQTESQI